MMAAATSLPWYVARSAGWVAWLLCAASVGWGLTLSSRLVRRRGAPAWLLASHRFLGLLTVVFISVHLVGLWLDSYVSFDLGRMLIPMRSTYRPLAVAWGIVALYLALAVELTSLLMRHIPRRWWHRIHLCSFLLLALATLHAFTAGTDRSNALGRWVALLGSATLIFLVTFRLVAERRAQRDDLAAARRARATAQADTGAVTDPAEVTGMLVGAEGLEPPTPSL